VVVKYRTAEQMCHQTVCRFWLDVRIDNKREKL